MGEEGKGEQGCTTPSSQKDVDHMNRGKLHKSYTIRAGCWNCIYAVGHEEVGLFCNRKGDEPVDLAPLRRWQKEHRVLLYGFCNKWELA
jgi:hypothetical protein